MIHTIKICWLLRINKLPENALEQKSSMYIYLGDDLKYIPMIEITVRQFLKNSYMNATVKAMMKKCSEIVPLSVRLIQKQT